uniref:PHD-type domain-containing protein n=1 Tax=Panagrolaimus sp. ES5 TaxID=591445 RepID=A0AC34F2F6_9BILA
MAPVSRAKAKAELAENGPKTRSKRKEIRSSSKNMDKKKPLERRLSVDSLIGSSDEQKKTKKKPKRKKNNDNEDEEITDDEYSDDSDEDHQYIIYGENLKKKYKVRYYDEFGIEDEIKEMKDPTFKKDNYKVVRAEYVKAKPRCRNVNECVVCDEMGEELISCARCPASFHTSCIESAMPSKKRPYEPWYCKRCRYEQNVLKKPKRVAKVLPFDEEERYISTVEETLKKIPDEEMTLSKAFDVLAGLANPKGFVMPKDVLDHLVDMPYMEHIPRKLACSKDSICYSCKKHPSQNSPAIECDYCPAKFHLHCLESPMTEVFNEFWMCPLHGEIGIDRFVLNTTGISKRMHYWNKCRAKVNPQKTWKEFIRKIKKEPTKKTEEKTFGGDVPTVIDWKFVKHHKLAFKDKEASASQSSESSDDDITEEQFMETTPKETSNFENANECNDQATVSSKPFYEYLNPKRYVAKNGFYPPELMNAKASYFGSDGLERDSTDMTHVPIEDLYYPEDETQTSLAEEAAREIMQKYPFLLKAKESAEDMDVEMPEASFSKVLEKEIQPFIETNFEQPKIIESEKSIREQVFEEIMDVEETPPSLELLGIAELFNGQFCFPIKLYRRRKYFVEYYTDGSQIIGLFKKLLPSLNLQLPEEAYNTETSITPESFTRILSLEDEEKSEETALSSENGIVIQNSSGIESEYDSDAGCDFYSTGTMTDAIKKQKSKKVKTKENEKINDNQQRIEELSSREMEKPEFKKENSEDLLKKVNKIKMKQMKKVPKEKLTLDVSIIEKSKKNSASVEKKSKQDSESDSEVVIIETPAYRRALRKAKQEAAKARKEEEEKIIAEAAKRGESIPITVTTTPAVRRGGRRKRGRSRKGSVRGMTESTITEIFKDVTPAENEPKELEMQLEKDETNDKILETEPEMLEAEFKMPILVPENIHEQQRHESPIFEAKQQKHKSKKYEGKSKNVIKKKKNEKPKKKKRKGAKDKISATSAPRLVPVIRKRSKSMGKIVKISSKISKSNTRSKFFRSISLPPPLIGPVQSNQEKKLKPSPKPTATEPIQTLREEQEDLSFDFTKLMKLECRKVGHFLYLMAPQRDSTFLIISRMAYTDQVLAYFSNYQEQQKLITASFKYPMTGEEGVINYNNVISAVSEYEKVQKRCFKLWKPNFGIIEVNEIDLKKNVDDANVGEYILDKRFVIPSLPIIGSLFIIGSYHSFATIPIYYPTCNIGNTNDDTINLSILAPKCNFIRKKHCSIIYDRSNCCVYIKPLGYTVIDKNLYGGVSTTKTLENICPCVKSYRNAKFIGNRIMRINITNDTVIQIGCLKFKVMIIPIEQIWEQIPDSNLRISDTRLPITLKPSMNVAPDPFDDELSGSSVSNTDSECEHDVNKDMTNSYVIM